jgi:lipopolysaccharide assembly outer membrane protein LptD (OstA)
MKKTFFFVACVVVGSSHLRQWTSPKSSHPLHSRSQKITAQSVERTGQDDTVTFRGSVRMVLDNTTTTADEVPLNTIFAATFNVTVNPR